MLAVRGGWVAVVLCLGACALPAKRTAEPVAVAECRSSFAAIDARVRAAGVGDARHHRVPGYPYLRSDRLLASFGAEMAREEDRFWRWLWLLRETDSQARELELLNLGLPQAERADELATLRQCGATLADLDFAEPDAQARLVEAAAVPDDYSATARALGLYPFALPFLKLGIANYQAQVRRDYARPIASLDAPGPLILWVPAGDQIPLPRFSGSEPRDDLGRIALTGSQWRDLAQAHAPAWWIETAGDHDLPGAPQMGPSGPDVDTGRAVVYFQPGFTRFGGETLVQVTYLAWFSERPSSGFYDPYAGRLDGLIWRVTLDRLGQPIAHDSIHACGCYHYWFPQPRLQPRGPQGLLQETPIYPQTLAVDRDLALRVQSGTHYLRRVVPRAEAPASETRRYDLRPYEELLSLPQAGGIRRSLFGPNGLVRGTERGERRWLWPSGVQSPGAMRVLGRHATAFVGRRHFDDSFLMDELFVLRSEAISAVDPDRSATDTLE